MRALKKACILILCFTASRGKKSMIMNDILNSIRNCSTIAVAFHVSPDGDSLGSSLALVHGLRKMGKKVYILSRESLPEDFRYLPGSCEINGENADVPDDVKCLIVLDCGDLNRVNANIDYEKRNFIFINIDHHISNSLFGDFNYVDSNSSAVGEIVYQILMLLGVQIDKNIASCLYTSIITDTGSFKYSSTTSVTHSIAGDLINTGIDFSEIHRVLYENKKFERLKLYGLVLSNIELVHKNICIMYLTKDMFLKANIEENTDTSDIISLGIQIDSVEVVVLFKENNDGVKISLRSKNIVDVRKVAECFGGGGHIRASGISLKSTSIENVKRDIINTIEKELV
jgi:bifunctional oligoribonuclease and PAP phosphatase NrnA